MEKRELDLALDKAKLGIVTGVANSVFISTVLFSLPLKWSEQVPTAATNGKQILINPDFFMGLVPEERIFLLLHEAWHVAFDHMARLKDFDPKIWNYACDYVINAMLIKLGLKMPKGGLYSRQYEGMFSEEVYKHLMADPPDEPEGFMFDLEAPDAADQKDVSRQIEDIVVRASIRSKQSGEKPGTIPQEIERWIDSLLNPKLPWNVILQNYFTEYAPEDYTYQRVSRRYMPIYIPTLYSESLGDVVFAVDTSGSVEEHQLQAFLSECYHVAADLQPSKLTLIDWDYTLHNIREIETADDLYSFPFTGGGGTTVAPLMEWAIEHKPRVMIILTDGYFYNDYAEPTETDVIWAVYNNSNFTPNFGRVIEYPLDT